MGQKRLNHVHVDAWTGARPRLTCWAVLFPSWAETSLNVSQLVPLCWQAVRMVRSAALKQAGISRKLSGWIPAC